ncbi:MAG: fibronectin type III domain-containing protein, partial [Candidatus Marinimicrobia bacterium]|nr:fibronectin type III domain-containing protein [Candidatus Neomarinimicrobiota bacterium]
VTRIQILYTADGGATYTEIVDSTENDGKIIWRVPRTPSTNARVKIIAYDAQGLTGVDSSDGFFTIEDVDTYVHATGAVSHTIRNDGKTGSGASGPNPFDPNEPSLEYPATSGNNHLYIGQLLLLAVSPVGDTIAARPFMDNYRPEAPITVIDQGSYIETNSRFSDNLGLGGIQVLQKTIAANGESAVIHAYKIRNNSPNSYNEFYIGFFNDFDINEYAQNLVGYDAGNRLAYMYEATGGWGSYAGIRLLDNAPSSFRFWGGALGGPETEAELFQLLATPEIDADATVADEYRVAETFGPVSLAKGDSVTIAFALAAGADLAGLQAASQAAQELWTSLATVISPPVVATNAATNITDSSATLNATVNPNNDETEVVFEWGKVGSFDKEVTADPSPLPAGTIEKAVKADLWGLEPETQYNFRVKATNGGGASPGADLQFTTLAKGVEVPVAITNDATEITATGATLRGSVDPNDNEVVVT